MYLIEYPGRYDNDWPMLSRILATITGIGIISLAPFARALEAVVNEVLVYPGSFARHAILSSAALICLIAVALYVRTVHARHGKGFLFRHAGLLVTALILVSTQVHLLVEIWHLVSYGVLGSLIAVSLPWSSRIWLTTLFYGNLVSLADEVFQGILPDRFFDLRDLLLNFSGIIIGIFLVEPFARTSPGQVLGSTADIGAPA
ncbi:MAG: hypothetical protein DCC75_08250 [Proteobacteria bacterium]|nr:MAG: hypothetical protein DCC75_08250 [Pseudomonadota bacterium]